MTIFSPNAIKGLVGAAEMAALIDGARFVTIDFETTGLERDAGILGFAVCTDKGVGYIDWRNPTNLEDEELLKGELACASAHLPIVGWNLKFDLHLLYRLTGVVCQHPIGVDCGLWLLNENAALGLKENLGVITGTEWPTFKDYLKKAQERLKVETDGLREQFCTDHISNGYKRKTDARRDVATRIPYPRAVPADISLTELAPYCCRDVLATTLAWLNYVRPALEEVGLLTYFYRYEMPFLRTLWKGEHNGIAVDRGTLRELSTEAFGTTESLAAELRSIAGRPEFNPNSNDHLKWLLFEHLGFAVGSRRTKSGEISLDERAIKDLIEEYAESEISGATGDDQNGTPSETGCDVDGLYDETDRAEDEGRANVRGRPQQVPLRTDVLELILKYRDAKKIHSTYADALPKLLDQDDRLHTRYVQTGTVTGRLSSADPNLQNIPKDKRVRRAFVARKGFVFVEADLSQAELRILADRTGDPKLMAVYEEGRDVHQSTMDLLGIEDRRVAKIVNFLMVYGGGPKVLRDNLRYLEGIKKTLKECKALISGFYSGYAYITPWKEQELDFAREHGYVRTRIGRYRHLPELRNPDAEWSVRSYAERQAINTEIQGDVADLMRVIMPVADERAEGFGGYFVGQVHDSLMFELPEAVAIEGARAIQQIMSNAMTFSIPMKADVKIGPNWGDAKELPEAA